MKKNTYLITALFILMSNQSFSSNQIEGDQNNNYKPFSYWKEVHKEAKTNPEKAYEIGCAWIDGEQGFEKNFRKGILSLVHAMKLGSKEADEKLKDLPGTSIGETDSLSKKVSNDWDNPDGTGEAFVEMGIWSYKYKGDKSNAVDMFNRSLELHDERNHQSTPIQQKWLAESYLWLGIMFYKGDIWLANATCLQERQCTQKYFIESKKYVNELLQNNQKENLFSNRSLTKLQNKLDRYIKTMEERIIQRMKEEVEEEKNKENN